MAARHQQRVKKAASKESKPKRSMLRSFFVWFLVVVSAIGIMAYTVVSWTEKQILTTENWVAFVSPLPKNPAVKDALSNFIVDKVFDEKAVEARVTEVLPPRAGFLAGPLTERVESATRRTTEALIGSDTFQTLWTGANRLAHERLITRARTELSPPEGATNQRFNINLSGVRPVLQERLGKLSEALPEKKSDSSGEGLSIKADLQARAARVRKTIRTIDFLHDVLPYLLAATVLGAVAISQDRRKTMLYGSVLVFVLCLFQLIGVKALQPAILDKIQNFSYRPAVGELYNALLFTFNEMIYGILVLSAIIWAAMVLAGPGSVGSMLRRFIHMNQFQETGFYHGWRRFRIWIAENKYYIWGITALLALLFLAFATDINWTVFINTLLSLISLIALAQLLATPPYLIQKKA